VQQRFIDKRGKFLEVRVYLTQSTEEFPVLNLIRLLKSIHSHLESVQPGLKGIHPRPESLHPRVKGAKTGLDGIEPGLKRGAHVPDLISNLDQYLGGYVSG
jgi:hypothetical protein